MKNFWFCTFFTSALAGTSIFCGDSDTNKMVSDVPEIPSSDYALLVLDASNAYLKIKTSLDFHELKKEMSKSSKNFKDSIIAENALLSLNVQIYRTPLVEFLERLPADKLLAFHHLITHPQLLAMEKDIWTTLTDTSTAFRYHAAFDHQKKPELPNTRLGQRFKACVEKCEWAKWPKHNMFYDLHQKLLEIYPEAVALINCTTLSLEDFKARIETSLALCQSQYIERLKELIKTHMIHPEIFDNH